MKTSLSFAKAAEIETDCLALCVLDQGEKDKNVPQLLGADKAIEAAAALLDHEGDGNASQPIIATVYDHRNQRLGQRLVDRADLSVSSINDNLPSRPLRAGCRKDGGPLEAD